MKGVLCELTFVLRCLQAKQAVEIFFDRWMLLGVFGVPGGPSEGRGAKGCDI